MPGFRCGRCGGIVLGRAGHRWCVCGWSEDATAGSGAVEEPRAVRRRDLHENIGRRWTANEFAFLYRNRNRLSLEGLARQLGRSRHAVEQMLSKKGWAKRRVGNGTVRKASGRGTRWTDEEVLTLLSTSISSFPGRSRSAIRVKLWREREGGFRSMDGCMGEAEVARVYGAPLHRVRSLRLRGVLAPEWRFGSWRYDPEEVEAVRDLLEAPKKTWRGEPPQTGDYERRYGLRRTWDAGLRRAGPRRVRT